MKKRRRTRLRGYDYTIPGYYFITICTRNRVEWFGEIEDDKMILNEIGKIVKIQWLWLVEQYLYVDLDEFIVMPNHIHGILILNDDCVGNGRDRSSKVKSISSLIGAFKTKSSKIIRKNILSEFGWQKSFYDHIIINEKSLNEIREYIKNNLFNWSEDKENIRKKNTKY